MPRRDGHRRFDPHAGDSRLLAGISTVMRRLPVILMLACLPFLAAAAYLKLLPPRYSAVAGVFADPAAGRVGGASMAQADGYIPLATSRPVFDRALVTGNLSGDASIVLGPPPLPQRLRDIVDRLRGQPPENQSRRAALLQHLDMYAFARPSSDANVLDIVVSATDGPSATRLANAVAEAFVEEASAALERRPAPGATRRAGRGEDLRRQLRAAEASLQQFRADAGLSASTDPALELQRLRTQAEEAKSKYEQVQQALAGGRDGQELANLVRTPAIDRLRVEANEAASQESSMRSTLGPRHPSYIEAAANAAEKKKLLAESLRLSATAIRADWQAAEAQVKALESGSVAARVASSPVAGSAEAVRLAELEGAVRAARSALDVYLRSPEAGGDAAIARIVRPASMQQGAPTPRPALIWSLATAAALTIAIWKIIAVLASPASGLRRRKAVHTRSETEAGLVRAPRPGASGETQPEPSGRLPDEAQDAGSAHFVERRGAAGVRKRPGHAEIAGIARELSDRAWSVALQTTLVVGADGADVATAAMEIAIGAADENLRVLLLDADERAPALSRVLSDVPLSAYVMIQGRKRAMGLFESKPGHPIWFAPAESLSYARGRFDAPLILPGLAGHFDVLLLTGPDLGARTGEDLLAAAAELVAVVTTGEDRDPAVFAASLRVPSSKLRVIPGAVPMIERRSAERLDEPSRSASLFRFQDD